MNENQNDILSGVAYGEELPEATREREFYIPALMGGLGKALARKSTGKIKALGALGGALIGSGLANASYTPDELANLAGAEYKGTPEEMAMQAEIVPQLQKLQESGEARRQQFLDNLMKAEYQYQQDVKQINQNANDVLKKVPEYAKKFRGFYE